jgi:hypothetical protein
MRQWIRSKIETIIDEELRSALDAARPRKAPSQ